jgi:hypothetical protein
MFTRYDSVSSPSGVSAPLIQLQPSRLRLTQAMATSPFAKRFAAR